VWSGGGSEKQKRHFWTLEEESRMRSGLALVVCHFPVIIFGQEGRRMLLAAAKPRDQIALPESGVSPIYIS
jgi:hypothetical protein